MSTEWGSRFILLLDEAFQTEHLSSARGKSYGAGRPVSAADLLQSAMPGEEIEHYPEILVDEWAAQHVIDQELGLETILEFDLGGSEDISEIVQFVVLDTDLGRSFLGRKVEGQPLEFLVAVDQGVRSKLLSALLLTLLAADAAFGDETKALRLPVSITNSRPDIVSEAILRRGFEMMLDGLAMRGVDAWEALAKFEQPGPPTPTHDRLLGTYFDAVYSERD